MDSQNHYYRSFLMTFLPSSTILCIFSKACFKTTISVSFFSTLDSSSVILLR